MEEGASMSKQLTISVFLNRFLSDLWASNVRLRIVIILVLTALVAGLYVNSLGNDFVNWDDPGNIVNNGQIRSLDWSNLKGIFSLRKASTYQPIRVLSYAIDYHFWELNPLGYHITNIAFYLFTCIMVFFTTCELLKFLRPEKSSLSHTRIAFFTTLLFAVHPVHVEAVTWLSARKEVLLGFFSFSSLYFYLMGTGASDGAKKGWLYGLASLCFILAALSKPVAVVLPGLVLLFEFSRDKIGVARFRKKLLWFVPAVVFSLFLTYILLRVMVEADGIYPYRGGDFLSNFLVAFYLFILNIKLMALTVNYSPLYILSLPYPVIGIWMFVFVLLNLGLIALAVFMFKKSKVFFFAVFWFYISILPYSNIIPISTPLADRYVFVPSFAYCLVLALAFERLWSVKLKGFSRDFFPSFTIPLFVLLLAGYSYMTVYQNRIWKDSFTLWSDALAKDPRNNVAMNSLGVVYLDNGMDEKAFELLKKAVEINPIDPLAHNNLGIAYQNLGEYGKSEYHFLRALSLKPDLQEPRVNLGNLFVRKGDHDKAIAHFKEMLAEEPRDARTYFRLGYVQEKVGNLDEAIKNYEKSLELSPHIINPYESLGRLYSERLNDREKALYFFRKGIQMAPNSKRVKEIEDMIKSLMSN